MMVFHFLFEQFVKHEHFLCTILCLLASFFVLCVAAVCALWGRRLLECCVFNLTRTDLCLQSVSDA